MEVVALTSAPGDRFADRGLYLSPARALQIAVLLLVVGNLGRIPVLDLGHRAAPLLVNDVAVGLALAIGGLAMLKSKAMRLNDVAVSAIVFASIGGLSAIAGVERFGFSALELIASLAYLARWFFYFALYVVVINCVRARDSEAVWDALETAMLIIVAFGLVQAVTMPNFAFMVYPDDRESYDWDSQRHRLVSTILEPNIASGMILTALLVQVARLAYGAKQAWWKALLMFAGLVATLSRGGMLSFAVGGLTLLVLVGLRKQLLKFGAAMLAMFLAALPGLLVLAKDYNRLSVTDASTMGRVLVWGRAISTLLDYPWFGVGFNAYGFVQERRGFERMGGSSYSVEGGLLFVAVMTGIIGLAVYLTMLWCVLRRSRRARRDARTTPEERGLLAGATAATIAILVHSVFVNSLLTPWVMEPLWILWGLSFVIASDLSRRPAHATA